MSMCAIIPVALLDAAYTGPGNDGLATLSAMGLTQVEVDV